MQTIQSGSSSEEPLHDSKTPQNLSELSLVGFHMQATLKKPQSHLEVLLFESVARVLSTFAEPARGNSRVYGLRDDP